MSSLPRDCTPDMADYGIGLRSPHVADVREMRPSVGWLEVHPENYMTSRAAFSQLLDLREHYPIALHGVGLSLGGAERPDPEHLMRMKRLVLDLEPMFVSEHLSWSVNGAVYFNDLLPLPYTEESLNIFFRNVLIVQEALGRSILIENPSSYLSYAHSTIEEPEFLTELVGRTGCEILCDVNNVHVSSHNLGFDAKTYVKALPRHAIREIHLAGHADKGSLLIDDHGSPVKDEVWTLYDLAIRRAPGARTLVEWDSNLPALNELVGEAEKAARRVARVRAELANPPSLERVQRVMAGALRGDGVAGDIAGLVADETVARVAVHRNNFRLSLTEALKTTYPAVCRLVDERFFAYAAHAFIDRHPPATRCLSDYGESFPDFLAAFPACASVPYIGDVARLEWALTRAKLAGPSAADLPAKLSKARPEQLGDHRFLPADGVAYLSSPWPIDRLWQMASGQGEAIVASLEPFECDFGLEIQPAEDGPFFRRLPRPIWLFRHSLASGETLAAAAGRALASDALFDLCAALRDMLDDAIFIDCWPTIRAEERSVSP